MPTIPILCLVCGQTLPEDQYMQHMQTVHGGLSTDKALQKQKFIEQNKAVPIPTPNQPVPITPTGLPPGVRPEDLPSPEFMKLAAEIDAKQVSTPTSGEITTAEPLAPLKPLPRQAPSIPPSSPPPKPVEQKPIELHYQYGGNCNKGHNVDTIMLEVDDKLYAVCYCVTCRKDIKKIKVQPIVEKQKGYLVDSKTKKITGEIEIPKKEVKHANTTR